MVSETHWDWVCGPWHLWRGMKRKTTLGSHLSPSPLGPRVTVVCRMRKRTGLHTYLGLNHGRTNARGFYPIIDLRGSRTPHIPPQISHLSKNLQNASSPSHFHPPTRPKVVLISPFDVKSDVFQVMIVITELGRRDSPHSGERWVYHSLRQRLSCIHKTLSSNVTEQNECEGY